MLDYDHNMFIVQATGITGVNISIVLALDGKRDPLVVIWQTRRH